MSAGARPGGTDTPAALAPPTCTLAHVITSRAIPAITARRGLRGPRMGIVNRDCTERSGACENAADRSESRSHKRFGRIEKPEGVARRGRAGCPTFLVAAVRPPSPLHASPPGRCTAPPGLRYMNEQHGWIRRHSNVIRRGRRGTERQLRAFARRPRAGRRPAAHSADSSQPPARLPRAPGGAAQVGCGAWGRVWPGPARR